MNSQKSILQFFGKNSSKKDASNNESNKPKFENTSKIKGIQQSKNRPNEFMKELNEEKSSKKRKHNLLMSDSDSNESLEQKIKIMEKDTSKNEGESIEVNNDHLKEYEKESEILTKILPINYDPVQPTYHIVKNACWNSNEKVPYLALTRTFEEIDSNTKRLEITRILSNFFRSVIYLSPNDLLASVYLCLNKVAPDYEGSEFGIGEDAVKQALVQSTDTNMEALKSRMKIDGDLGIVAYNLPSSQRYLVQPTKLTIAAVFKKLKEFVDIRGKSAKKMKIGMVKDLLNACTKCEKKYLVRSLLGKLRISLAEQTVLAALSQAVTLTPPNDSDVAMNVPDLETMKPAIDKNTGIIKNAFCECPNFDRLIDSIIKYGVSELPNHCSIYPGVPIKPMLAHPSKGVTEIFRRFDDTDFACEYKYDGERAQIHVSTNAQGKRQMRIFSRNQEDNTTKYPDIITLFTELLSSTTIDSCIVDSEAVAFDRVQNTILPFQKLSTRKKKDVVEGTIEVQVCVYAFDLIYLNGQSLVRKSFRERRNILREHFPEIPNKFMLSTTLDSSNTEEISEFLTQSIRDNCEGLMIKTLDRDATYEISKRSHNWLKLKKDYLDSCGDTFDLVVIGASYGGGKRANIFGSYLLACYNPQSGAYQTICNLGSGLSDTDLNSFHNALINTVTKKPSLCYEYDKSSQPDFWFEPTVVWEIKAADLSISPNHKAAMGMVDNDKGISLRFPRFVRVRDDKKPENATTSRQIAEMYLNQDIVKNSAANTVNPFEDDEFY